ncbi:MAG TPA: SgcJ/EcaC family oxidoreductase [Gemmatimonadota bacterium]|nr:SgcJ/EcaC family oxidoreductase [Gemmatimonadota bacterium]
MTRWIPPLAFAALQMAAPAAAQVSDVGAELDAVYDRFTAAYAAADAAAVADLYTEDAYYLSPDQDVVRGRAEIQEGFARFLGRFEPGAGPAIDFEILDRNVAGDLATDIGYYRMSRPGGEPRRAGKFVVVWRRGADGAWRIHADGYSGVSPPAE